MDLNDLVKFLKKNHAFSELKSEIKNQSSYNVTYKTLIQDVIAEQIPLSDALKDNLYFKWSESTCGIDWEKLDAEWRKLCR